MNGIKVLWHLSRKNISSRQKEKVLLLCSALLRCPVLGPLAEESCTYWRQSSAGPQRCLWHWSSFHARGAETCGTVHFAKEGLGAQQGAGAGLANVYKYLTRANKKVGARSFSVVPTDSTKGKRQKLKSTKISYYHKNKLNAGRGCTEWLAPLKIFKT